MKFRIFDVRHGFCAALYSNNYLTLIDCGHDFKYQQTPLQWLAYLGYRHINNLIISNFDQDHISDIKTIEKYFTVDRLIANPNISSYTLRQIKDEITDQMAVVLANIDRNDLKPISEYELWTPEIQYKFYSIKYPSVIDTNNLSLVTFFKFGPCNIIYAGDMEKHGWDILLCHPEFRKDLQSVNFFIASHHGRQNGYHPKIFEYCCPYVVAISDQERVYGTQQHDLYSKHAQGIDFGKLGRSNIRKVLTTRNDGDITIHSEGNQAEIFLANTP